MKLKNICIAVVALALAVGMTACGGSALPRLLPLRLLLLRLLPPLPPKFNAHSVHNRIAKGRCTLFCAAAFLIAQKDLNALRVCYGHNQRNDFFRDTGSSANAPVSHFYEKRPPHKAMYSSPSRLRSKLPNIIFQGLRESEQGRRQRRYSAAAPEWKAPW